MSLYILILAVIIGFFFFSHFGRFSYICNLRNCWKSKVYVVRGNSPQEQTSLNKPVRMCHSQKKYLLIQNNLTFTLHGSVINE